MHKMPLVVLAGFFLLAAQSAVAAPHHKDCRPLWHKDRAANYQIGRASCRERV